MIYYFARPNQMTGHRFTDDVAICFALNKEKARKKFGMYYENVKRAEVKRINLFTFGIYILTDY